MTLSVQFATILAMILGGIYLGAAIETFRRFEPYWKKRIVFSYLIEISFWLLQTLILFYLLYLVNQGELRLYIFLAVFCGYASYKGLFEGFYKNILERFIELFVTTYRFLHRVINQFIITPIKKLVQAIIVLILWIWTAVLWVIMFALKIVFYPFRFISRILYRILPKDVKKYLHYLEGIYSKIKNIFLKWWKLLKNKRR
jgi:spore cortex biosynthesis protein YabQ